MPDGRDFELRSGALERIRELQHLHIDLVPLTALASGFSWRGQRSPTRAATPRSAGRACGRSAAESNAKSTS